MHKKKKGRDKYKCTGSTIGFFFNEAFLTNHAIYNYDFLSPDTIFFYGFKQPVTTYLRYLCDNACIHAPGCCQSHVQQELQTCICLSSFSDNLSCLLSLKLYIYIQDNLSDRIKLKQCLLIAVLWLHCFLSQFFLLLYMTSKTLYFKRWINDKCTAADVVYSPNLQLPNFSSKQGY